MPLHQVLRNIVGALVSGCVLRDLLWRRELSLSPHSLSTGLGLVMADKRDGVEERVASWLGSACFVIG